MGRASKILICLAAGIGAHALFSAWDQARLKSSVTEEKLAWSRQISSQVEGLAYVARQELQRDPIGWAARQMNQGQDPRVVHLDKIHEASAKPERYSYDSDLGVFDYSKTLLPETGEGVRIRVVTGYVGFLGVRSRGASDLLRLGNIAFFALLLGLAWRSRSKETAEGGNRSQEQTEGGPTADVQEPWAQKAKTLLVELTTRLRDTIRCVQHLTAAACGAGKTIPALKSSAEEATAFSQSESRAFEQLEALTRRVEALSLNLAIDAARLGQDGKSLCQMAEDIHRTLRSVQQQRLAAEQARREVLIRVQTIEAGLGEAARQVAEVGQAAQEMDTHIDRTSAAVRQQSDWVRSLSQRKAS